MRGGKAVAVALSERQRGLLEALSRSRTSAAFLVERAQIILHASAGEPTLHIARAMGVDRQRVRRWRNRWATELSSRLLDVEAVADDKVLHEALVQALGDAARSGAPPKFTPEQEEQVRAMACRDPSEFGLPHSQWTRRLLADEAARQGIVESVSVAEVGRWLKKGGSSHTGVDTG